ncbi:hypothetical protein Poli38472_012854 [Pythium oligandrum]|uniref:Uncharacterized protein n=1 Tax=Pythium oligandrum TaxID=41045 RepID=A0A8K1FLV9_PYTOL|nr:hypothetical protein Poli38472_012854 [Pythium oligandrum]|eukprot:TMW64232.1 hypothetical protein Poli38472_012854 [Pythium oligandrum]
MRLSSSSTQSHSDKAPFAMSPVTSEGRGTSPGGASGDYVEGPWDQRLRHFQNVLLHVCSFILILEFAERVSYYGINQGLKNYMGKIGWSQVGSNSLKSTWTSICYLSPLLGGYIADEKWGRFKTLWVFGVWYTCGAFLIALSAHPSVMQSETAANIICNIGLFVGVAVGTGAIKANVITFGADQFDPNDPNEVTQKEAFFSYFYIVINLGAIFSYGYLSVLCVQGSGAIPREYGYFANFCICGGIMVVAYALFLLAYQRYVHFPPQDSAISKLWSIVRGNCKYSYEARMLYYGLIAFGVSFVFNLLAAFLAETASLGQYLSYLVVALCVFGMYAWIRYGMSTAYMDKSKASNGGQYNDEMVDEIKMVIRVLPFACFMIMWECAYDQLDANFQSIAQQCDLRIGSDFEGDHGAPQVPGAMLGIFDPLTIIVLIPILDGFVYPLYTNVTGRLPSAFGKVLTGLVVSTFTMFWAGAFEVIRRDSGELRWTDPTGLEHPIFDQGSDQPMNRISWGYAVPMYVLVAVAECLINVTAYELFYNEVPVYLKSTCQAINLFMVAMGSNLTSTFTLIFQDYIPQSLNDGHFEYMYYTLGALSVVNTIAFVIVMQWMDFGMNKDDDDDSLLEDVTLVDSRGNDIMQRQRHSSFESISLSRG